MSLFKLVKTAKFDIPKNSNAQNITDFLVRNNITAGRLLHVETIFRTDDLQTILVFYVDGNLENLPIPKGPKGDPGDPGNQGPKGESVGLSIDATCVWFYKAIGDKPCAFGCGS